MNWEFGVTPLTLSIGVCGRGTYRSASAILCRFMRYSSSEIPEKILDFSLFPWICCSSSYLCLISLSFSFLFSCITTFACSSALVFVSIATSSSFSLKRSLSLCFSSTCFYNICNAFSFSAIFLLALLVSSLRSLADLISKYFFCIISSSLLFRSFSASMFSIRCLVLSSACLLEACIFCSLS